jgi:hypothetical protein
MIEGHDMMESEADIIIDADRKEPEATIEIQTDSVNLVIDSQLFTTIMACGRKGDFRFNRHFHSVRGKSVSLEMGSAVHINVEHYNKAIISGVTRKEAAGFGMIACEEYMRSDEWVNGTDDDKQTVRNTMEQYYEYRKNDSWVPLNSEFVRGKLLYEDEDIRILWKAKLDLETDTNDGIFPVDYKSMKQRRDTTSLNNQFIGQCLVSGTQRMIVDKIGFQTSLKVEEKFTRHVVNYSYDRLLEWRTVILPYWAKIYLMYAESGYWPPNYTQCENKYGFCEFRMVCEGDRPDRERILGKEFYVGEPWDINNLVNEES